MRPLIKQRHTFGMYVLYVCVHVESFIRPVIKQRRQHPLSADDAKADLVSLIINARNENGEPLSPAAIEVCEAAPRAGGH